MLACQLLVELLPPNRGSTLTGSDLIFESSWIGMVFRDDGFKEQTGKSTTSKLPKLLFNKNKVIYTCPEDTNRPHGNGRVRT